MAGIALVSKTPSTQLACNLISHKSFRTAVPIMMGRRAAKIANRKGKTDAIRTKLYGKFGKQIISACKAGGSNDPGDNQQLKDVLKMARGAGVPKDLIERNLKNSSDDKQGDFELLTYEAYGLGGIGFVIESLSDNKNRTAADVRDIIRKGGGNMAESGSVMFNFERKGYVIVKEADEEELFELALEAGAEDVEARAEGGYKVTTDFVTFGAVRDALLEAGKEIDAEASGLTLVPLSHIQTDDESYEANVGMLEKLLDNGDVDTVYHNQEMDEDEEESE